MNSLVKESVERLYVENGAWCRVKRGPEENGSGEEKEGSVPEMKRLVYKKDVSSRENNWARVAPILLLWI